ncbi:hypothetical protein BD310DRAFT_880718 [Dichomitus squalens]|uniref:Uncharacterized protein n=1 Tax=Dichomitus squalens TaxID=114155 RepID=A0A4Q9PT24_9APHY|nr:hypothetical protein BD310DRAFT_880718 [Dichomitus squalens]
MVRAGSSATEPPRHETVAYHCRCRGMVPLSFSLVLVIVIVRWTLVQPVRKEYGPLCGPSTPSRQKTQTPLLVTP